MCRRVVIMSGKEGEKRVRVRAAFGVAEEHNGLTISDGHQNSFGGRHAKAGELAATTERCYAEGTCGKCKNNSGR